MNIHQPGATGQPHDLQRLIGSTCYYHDTVGAWFARKPMQHLATLQRSCGSYWDRDGSEEPAEFNRELTYFIDAKQPSDHYLHTLLEIEKTNRVFINRVHPARDECCISRDARWDLHDFKREHETRKWHQKTQLMRHFHTPAGTDYDAQPGAPRILTRYGEKQSRRSGQPWPLHTEFRLSGVQSVRRAGIRDVTTLIGFDHVKWWQTKTALLTVPDYQRLGRMIRNQRDKTRSQSSEPETWQLTPTHAIDVDMDWRRGYEAWLSCACDDCQSKDDSGVSELQHLVDRFGMSRLLERSVVSVIDWVHASDDHRDRHQQK